MGHTTSTAVLPVDVNKYYHLKYGCLFSLFKATYRQQEICLLLHRVFW